MRGRALFRCCCITRSLQARIPGRCRMPSLEVDRLSALFNGDLQLGHIGRRGRTREGERGPACNTSQIPAATRGLEKADKVRGRNDRRCYLYLRPLRPFEVQLCCCLLLWFLPRLLRSAVPALLCSAPLRLALLCSYISNSNCKANFSGCSGLTHSLPPRPNPRPRAKPTHVLIVFGIWPPPTPVDPVILLYCCT